MTANLPAAERRALARKVAINGFVLLVAAIFAGDFILDFFGVTVPVLQLAGGLVVASLGFRLLHDSGEGRAASAPIDSESAMRSQGLLSPDAAADRRTRNDIGSSDDRRQFSVDHPPVPRRMRSPQ